MSIEGPHGTYVNSEGCVHELITLKTVTNTFPSSDPETEYSWFPGYVILIILLFFSYVLHSMNENDILSV